MRRVSVIRIDTGACWPYTGGAHCRDGYGRFYYQGSTQPAHRVSYVLHHGPLQPGDVVRHSCHNPACCNPAHLSAGTHADNVADRQAANRQARGRRNGRSKLTRGEVREIRRAADRGARQAELARQYGVHPTTVRDIIRRKTWRDA